MFTAILKAVLSRFELIQGSAFNSIPRLNPAALLDHIWVSIWPRLQDFGAELPRLLRET